MSDQWTAREASVPSLEELRKERDRLLHELRQIEGEIESLLDEEEEERG